MTESFAELFEASQANLAKLKPGSIVTGTVIQVRTDVVVINAGLKSEGIVPIEQFRNDAGEIDVAEGDIVKVALDSLENGFGETVLSREKAKRAMVWDELEEALEKNETVTGKISGKVKGGFTVDIKDVRAFLPGSLVDVRPVRDPVYLEGKELEFKLIKLDRKRNNVVVSRRAVVESEHSEEREQLMEKLVEGAVLKGVVKNLTDYGAFVDLGGIDGLLHITDMAWKRVRHPSEVVEVGQELDVRVLKYDRERNRVSLGLKQLGEDPWDNIARRYPSNTRVFGKVSNVTDYGAFVEIEPGVEGLVHVSEMDWTNKNVNPAKVVQVGDELEVMVLDVDEERRRISLGIKQVTSNPWETFAAIHKKGDKVEGQIKSITDFGIFIGLDGGIDGLIHLSDMSWNTSGEDVARELKKGDTLEAVVLAVDPERERISLGVKQLEQDPFGQFMANHPRGSKITGTVKEVDAKGAVIEVADGVEGYVAARDIADERVDDATQFLKVGQAIEAKFTGMDRKGRTLQLSIKAKDEAEVAETLAEYNRASADASSGTTKLGALLREQLDSKSE
ncbi:MULTISPECIES: 30S ribosomal protein S1 [unclassified Luteimonas]|uniref:30S ribosomal protein S1 n=1 Tax=unclassified Luteimonas TaxID=2629088 RepID=UPI0018F0A120|nr:MULTISPECIES: 30S ribosomal protein S1 [unclassified Luteimonas]MBJ6977914.1 30S ribosomal protein S1 [Luteimonas sp. MC1895]MBJ6984734.1 30S ribosomal protein S1 [Luteimonas sp. MC1750]QQO04669.1 30S ribosomal protein S1 [Luteimonas sp. MC1750]